MRTRELPAGPIGAALLCKRLRGNPAREAALEARELLEVGAQNELLEIPVHHHIHGLFAEVGVVALRGAVVAGGAPHEGVRGGARAQTQRERRPPRSKRERDAEHQKRPARRAGGHGR